MKVLIIHLTDLHIKNHFEFLKEKVESIHKIALSHNLANILFVFTGDISFSGEQTQYDRATSFVETLRDRFSQDKINGVPVKTMFAFCPGNHDRKMGQKRIGADYLGRLNNETFLDCVGEFSNTNSNYVGFRNKLGEPSSISIILDEYRFAIDGQTLCVYSLNNALLSAFAPEEKSPYDPNHGKIFLPREYLKIGRRNESLSLLLMHIPIEFFEETTKKAFCERCSKNVDLVFSGHTHAEEMINRQTHEDGSVIEVVSSALYANGASGFSCLEIDGNVVNKESFVFSTESCSYEKQSSEEVFEFTKKESTSYSQEINPSFLADISDITLDSHHKGKLDDIFVFPCLKAKDYGKSFPLVETPEQFLSELNKHHVLCITGDHGSGKTSLARYLFQRLVEAGFVPVICDGRSFRRKAETTINQALKENYRNPSIVSSFHEVPIEKRVLIIDDFDCPTDELIDQCLSLSENLVYFCESGTSLKRVFDKEVDVSTCHFVLEPFFFEKRRELLEKLYLFLSQEKRPFGDQPLSFDSFFGSFEEAISRLDLINTLDPQDLTFFAIQHYEKTRVFEAEPNHSFMHFQIKQSLEEALKARKYKNCNFIVAERIVSNVAMAAYQQRLTSFGQSLFEDALKTEIDEMGGDPIKSLPAFIDMLVSDVGLIRKNGEAYSFSSRKFFAYFVGKRAVNRFQIHGDMSLLNLITSGGIYSPLNFQILLSIATVYENAFIPNEIINDLYPLVIQAQGIQKDDLQKLAQKFDEKKEALLAISKEERDRMGQRRSKAEREERSRYLENIDNFFYEPKMDERYRNLVEWSNRTQIVSVLLNGFSSSLTKEAKAKLVEMVVKLPNITLKYLFDGVFDSLEDLFVSIQKSLINEDSNHPGAQIDQIREMLLSAMNACVLTCYDIGCRPLRSPDITEFVNKALQSEDDARSVIQKLMLLSFSSNQEAFVAEATKFIKGDNKYYRQCARLIGRRFCLDNYETVTKRFSGFANLIESRPKLIADKKKKDLQR